ncbi:MAG: DNA translocase FtsK, partial [Parcubacteria group bacterium]|nr:DNA translocase FtsK [Parcubacteria group bacterium]
NARIIQQTLAHFGIPVEMAGVHIGPTVTQYTLKPAQGVRLSKIVALHNDLALALAAHPLRIEAPIPGRALVGIEVPNKAKQIVRLRNLLQELSLAAPLAGGGLSFPLGRDVRGQAMFADIVKMPHLLVAGATGSGKSIFIHSLIMSLMFRIPPQLLKFLMIDPKRVELSQYDGIPYLLSPVITEGKKAVQALRWVITEMERRYDLLLEEKARDIFTYNQKVGRQGEPLAHLVVFIDELADLMTIYGREVETSVVRLSQMARATGIHLVVSTQRPSVEVITGLIKANITTRVAFQVASQVDSRTILDMAGAEKLLGLGDMLFLSPEIGKPRRIQGPFVEEGEVKKVVQFIREEGEKAGLGEEIMAVEKQGGGPVETAMLEEVYYDDDLYPQAYEVVVQSKKASASLLQRRLKVGYARAARLLDILEAKGVIGPGQGAKPREVFVDDERGMINDEKEKLL